MRIIAIIVMLFLLCVGLVACGGDSLKGNDKTVYDILDTHAPRFNDPTSIRVYGGIIIDTEKEDFTLIELRIIEGQFTYLKSYENNFKDDPGSIVVLSISESSSQGNTERSLFAMSMNRTININKVVKDGFMDLTGDFYEEISGRDRSLMGLFGNSYTDSIAESSVEDTMIGLEEDLRIWDNPDELDFDKINDALKNKYS